MIWDVLMQNGKVIASMSRQLKEYEKNYPAYDLELVAVVYHPNKANVVVDALSRKSTSNVANGILQFRGRLYVPDVEYTGGDIFFEAHTIPYSIHLGATKMYRDLKLHFWWPNMKDEIAKYVGQCLTRQQIKAEHQRLIGTLQPLPIPEWKYERFTRDFAWSKFLPLMEFAYNNSYQATIGMAPYKELYGRICESPVYRDDIGERKLLGPDMIHKMAEVVMQIRQGMQTAQDQQKSYAD
ncbi:uncharacterized protein LOC111388633 [Olea europaea var. sylvestris]|uniref:uncharacterized protein LOC111388633 n=1 Tax=Olea europaea var. sylvestris TaxID=158386 RepID=UPI000C1D20A2|nr:uncharacterized protein LOC111388633 [Olea europaea var. sylvestris]